MGLDMYLTAKRHFFDTECEKYKTLQKVLDCPFKAESVEVEVAYWRKSNQIHKWFVDNVQKGNDDCGTYWVDEDQLQELLNKVKKAITSKDPSTILPNAAGFFFGSTDYDGYYRQDLKNTKKMLEKFLKFEGRGKYELYYHSSW